MATLKELTQRIRKDWVKVSPCALPYLNAMECIESVNDNYMLDRGKDMVNYFLCNASTWRGAEAREVKKLLKDLVK